MSISIQNSRRKRRTLFKCSVRKAGFVLVALLLLYFQFLWSSINKNIEYHQGNNNNNNSNKDKTIPRQFSQQRTQPQSQTKKKKPTKTAEDVVTIGIASTVTMCGTDPFYEGAAVLKYSIEMTSIHGTKGGKYDYKFYVMYHPDAKECVLPLKDLGFTLLERPTPVNVSDIEGDVLRERIVKNGCCGEKELIKLEAYRLTQHPVVVHLDLDVLVLKPMDDVIDLMRNPSSYIANGNNNSNSPIMWPEKSIPDNISLIFTKDYNVVAPRRPDKPFQGGFFMVKPSKEIYQEIVEIVRKGDYTDKNNKKGWGGKVGPFHGGMTIQGLLPWYYEYLHPGMAVELNRCVYNNMADNPTTELTVNDIPQGRCRTNEEVGGAPVPIEGV
jgi:hypothetical protein